MYRDRMGAYMKCIMHKQLVPHPHNVPVFKETKPASIINIFIEVKIVLYTMNCSMLFLKALCP